MSNQPTLNKMKEMKLFGMFRAFENLHHHTAQQHLSADEMLALLIEAEYTDRLNRKINRFLKNARFRYQATFEQIDFHAQRNLDKTQILRLGDSSYIDRQESILITGPTGVGKSYLSSALGHQACMQGYKVLYFNTGKMLDQLHQMKADASYDKHIRRIARHDLLILDDFGLKPLTQNERYVLLEIIEDRHGIKSTIITSQLPVKEWYEIIGDKTIADAILDRIAHSSHRIKLSGESMRKKQADEKKKQ